METIWNLPGIDFQPLHAIRESRPSAVLTGRRSWHAVNGQISLPVLVQAEPYSTDEVYLDNMAASLPDGVEVVYGVGGGQVADAAKYIAWKNGLPSVMVPTALSVDGFFTALVALRRSGSIEYVTTGPAERVIIDWDIVSAAPRYLRGTGIAEILSMTTGLLDWQFAEHAGQTTPDTRFQRWAATIAAGIAQQAYRIAADVGRGRVDALRNLLDLICMEVQLTNQLGHNRPQEGSEQYFAYAAEELLGDEGLPYADLVGPGILISATLHGQNTDAIRETLDSAGVRLDRLRETELVDTLLSMPEYLAKHDLPYSILHSAALSRDEARDVIVKAGLSQRA
jgi:glycerol-1-phosphate dehydrogenase [NAD(P)+]